MGKEVEKDILLIRELDNYLKLTLQVTTRGTIQRYKTELQV